jgi:hypothetical protein
MKYLHEKVQLLGADIIEHELHSLEALKGNYDLVINCSGVWARQLVNDDAVYPIRGQVVVLKSWISPMSRLPPTTRANTLATSFQGPTTAFSEEQRLPTIGTLKHTRKRPWTFEPDAKKSFTKLNPRKSFSTKSAFVRDANQFD